MIGFWQLRNSTPLRRIINRRTDCRLAHDCGTKTQLRLTVDRRPEAFWQRIQFSSAIRAGNLQLVEFTEEKRIELYDLTKDIGESNSLAETQTADHGKLLAQLHDWRKQVGAADTPASEKRT